MPASAHAPIMPTAMARRVPGKDCTAIAMPTGIVAPPPSACTVLAAMRNSRFGAIAAASDPTAKTSSEARKSSAWPWTSARRAVNGMTAVKPRRYAVTIHAARSKLCGRHLQVWHDLRQHGHDYGVVERGRQHCTADDGQRQPCPER